MTRARKLTYSILAIVLVLFVFIIVSGNSAKKNAQKELNLPVSVVTADIIRGPIKENLSFTGTLAGKEQATLVSQTAGVVEQILFIPGQVCQVGQTLAVVENSQQQAAVDQAQAQVMAAQTNYEKAQSDLQRIQQLYNDKVATKDNLEMTQLQVRSAFAQLKGAQAGQKVAEKQLSDTNLKATLTGRIATKLINKGQTISPGTPVAQIVDDSEFRLKIFVPEGNITKVKQGQGVDVSVDVLPGKNFHGRIASVGLAYEDQGTAYPVDILVSKNGNSDLKSGMFARCNVGVAEKANALLIPQNAIVVENNQTFVYVVNGKKAAKKAVTLGLKSDDFSEVLNGISPEMKVITIGKEQLTDGADILTGASK